MPCQSDYEGEDLARTRLELDKVTRLLCAAVQALKDRHMLHFLTDEHKQWWQQHQTEDERRKARAEK